MSTPRTFFELLAGWFDMGPPSTGNPDLDEVLLYNYLAQACEACGTKPAHRHGPALHCTACCQTAAAAAVAAASRPGPAS